MAASKQEHSEASSAGGQRSASWRVTRFLLLLLILVGLMFAIQPARFQWAMLAGKQAVSDEALQTALEEFETARELYPDDAEVHFWLARTWRKLGDLERLRHFLDEARRLKFLNENRLRDEWRLMLAQTGNLTTVEGELGRMLLNEEDSVEVCEAFTLGYCLNLKFDSARQLIDAWQADHADDYRPPFYRGQILAGKENWSDAANEYRQALKLRPGQLRIKLGLAKCLVEQDQLEEASALLDDVTAEDPQNRTALMLQSRLLRESKEFDSAARSLRTLLAQHPDDFSARLLLAKVLLDGGKAGEASLEAQKLVDEWPDDLAAVYTLAQALRAAGRVDEAEAQFEHYAELGDVYAELERLKLEINSRPSDASLRLQIGKMVLAHVSREEGAAWLQSVLFIEPNHAEAIIALAEYYERTGDAEMARAFAQRAENLDSGDDLKTRQN